MATSAAAKFQSPEARALTERIAWAAFALLTAVYVGYFAQLTSYPYQDVPNHLTRAVVLADLLFDGGARFGELFEFDFLPVPYLLGDILFAGLAKLLGPSLAATLWMTLVLVSLPAALLFYTHVNGPIRNGRVFVLLLSLYLATDWFFLVGFTQFRLGLALMFVVLGCADLLRARWSPRVFVALCATLLVAYFSHLASIVFVAPSLAVAGAVRLLYRRTTLQRELTIGAPVLVVLLWHFGYVDRAFGGDAEVPYEYTWGSLEWRLNALQFELLRYGRPFAKVLMILLTVAVCWGLWRDLRWRNLLQPRVVEMLALTATFVAIYFILPISFADAEYVAVRALAPISLFIILGRVYLAEGTASSPASVDTIAVGLAGIIAVLNLAYIATHLRVQDAWGAGYRQIISQIPRGATVLPVYTGGRRGTINTRLHLGSLAVMEREALIPYLFSGDAGHPMKYFRYKRRPYAPRENWYVATKHVPVDWEQLACSYQYLLVGKPYDSGRIRVRTSTAAQNDSAALLAIAPGECEPTRRATRLTRQ